MANIPTAIPSRIIAGDTLQFRRPEQVDYPASDGWELHFTLVGASAVQSFAASNDADGWLVNVPSATTAAWASGRYTLTEYAKNGSERRTLRQRSVTVAPNLAGAQAGADTRTHARKVLDAIEAWLESRAPTTGEFQVAGRRLQNYPIPELLALRDKYRAEVMREEAAERGGRFGRLLVRM